MSICKKLKNNVYLLDVYLVNENSQKEYLNNET